MKKKLLYPNCSELIADFNCHDPARIYLILTTLARKFNWHFDPPLTLELLDEMTKEPKDPFGYRPRIAIVDSKGNVTHLEYGSNGYDDSLGFRLDSGCNHSDDTQFGFFAAAMEMFDAEMKAYDGGSTNDFFQWYEGKKK